MDLKKRPKPGQEREDFPGFANSNVLLSKCRMHRSVLQDAPFTTCTWWAPFSCGDQAYRITDIFERPYTTLSNDNECLTRHTYVDIWTDRQVDTWCLTNKNWYVGRKPCKTFHHIESHFTVEIEMLLSWGLGSHDSFWTLWSWDTQKSLYKWSTWTAMFASMNTCWSTSWSCFHGHGWARQSTKHRLISSDTCRASWYYYIFFFSKLYLRCLPMNSSASRAREQSTGTKPTRSFSIIHACKPSAARFPFEAGASDIFYVM